MMQLLLIYDIEEDRARTKVACACEDFGLDRVQYSAFCGRLSRNHQEELMAKIRRLLRDKTAKVQLIPIPADEWQRRIVIENE